MGGIYCFLQLSCCFLSQFALSTRRQDFDDNMASDHANQFFTVNRPVPMSLEVPNNGWDSSGTSGSRINFGAEFNMLFTPNSQSFPSTPQAESSCLSNTLPPTTQWHGGPRQSAQRGRDPVQEWARHTADKEDMLRTQRSSSQNDDLTNVRLEHSQTRYQQIKMKVPQLPSKTNTNVTQELIKKPASTIPRRKRAPRKVGQLGCLYTTRLTKILEERSDREGQSQSSSQYSSKWYDLIHLTRHSALHAAEERDVALAV